MDFLRRIEEDVRNLGVEAKRKHPEVKEAADRSLVTLKAMRDSYVNEVMRGNNSNSPKIAKFRSAEISSVYIIACDNPDANHKIVKLSLNGLQMLLNYEVIPPAEAPNILRILRIQARSGNQEIQLKVLQIVLQLANFLVSDSVATQYLTTPNVCGMLTLCLQLCGSGSTATETKSVSMSNVSVYSTAFATTRQLIALVMDTTAEILQAEERAGGAGGKFTGNIPIDYLPECARLLVSDLSRFVRGLPGEWIAGVYIPLSTGLDLLHDLVSGWGDLFLRYSSFSDMLRDPVCSSFIPLLKTMREDYMVALKHSLSSGTSANQQSGSSGTVLVNGFTSAQMVSRVMRIVNFFITHFYHSPLFVAEVEKVITLMAATLQPERQFSTSEGSAIASMNAKLQNMLSFASDDILKGSPAPGRYDDPSYAAANTGGLISRLAIVKGSAPTSGPVSVPRAHLFLSLQLTQGGVAQLPSHPAGLCLETMLSFFLNDNIFDVMVASCPAGKDSLTTLLTSVLLTVSGMVSEGVACEANMRDFESAMRGSFLVTVLEGLLTGADTTNRETTLKAIHDHLSAVVLVTPSDVLVMGFLILQVISRLFVRSAFQVANIDHQLPHRTRSYSINAYNERKFFPATENGLLGLDLNQSNSESGGNEPTSVELDVLRNVRAAISAVAERTFEKIQEACLVMLAKVEDAAVVRRSLGILSELALASGLLGQHFLCDMLLTSLCKLTVPKWHGQELMLILHEQLLKEKESTKSGPSSLNASAASSGISSNFVDHVMLRWRHVQAFVRLTQVVHFLGDVISDWDTIVDSFEQLVSILIANTGKMTGGLCTTTIHDELTSQDVDKIIQGIERFVGYSVVLSDETLVRLMTSLVALSLNSLAITSSSFTPTVGTSTNAASSSTPSSVSSFASRAISSPLQASSLSLSSSAATASTPMKIDRGASSDTGGALRRLQYLACESYMIDALSSCSVSYSLHAVVEITKLNPFRISTIWQMVASHLRVMASHKLASTRKIAVSATHDIILKTLNYLKSPSLDQLSKTVTYSEDDSNAALATLCLDVHNTVCISVSDSVLYATLMPSFETVFAGRKYQRRALVRRCDADFQADILGPVLTQSDLLVSLTALANIKYADVRNEIMQGLLQLLQDGGQIIVGGWAVIIDLLTSVPQSMCASESLDSTGAAPSSSRPLSGTVSATELSTPTKEATSSDGRISDESSFSSSSLWPETSLSIAFNCMKLIVDDFLECLDERVMKDLVTCVSIFSAQIADVNISLTSVEMLWKVTDYVMTSLRKRGDLETTSAVLDLMMTRLLSLTLDSRPEVRNCATNTLFSALVSNATMLTSAQWENAFEEVVFPLFTYTENRSSLAMRSNERATAPEIKKGVKMAVHHSRDTAHKQWSETRVMALRGLSRVLRTCTRLLTESWFRVTWVKSLDICVRAVHAGDTDMEVCLAGVDCVFDMIKMVSTKSYKTKARAQKGMRVVGGALVDDAGQTVSTISKERDEGGADGHGAGEDDGTVEVERQTVRQELWTLAWGSVRMSACYDCFSPELPVHLCKHLKEVYSGGVGGEFRYSQNVKSLLEICIILARMRLPAVLKKTGVLLSTSGILDGGSVVSIAPEVEEPIGDGEYAQRLSRKSKIDKTAISQLHRAILQLVQSVKPVDVLSYSCLVSAICSICCAGSYYAQISSPHDGRRIVLAPVDVKLRVEMGNYLISILNGYLRPEDSAGGNCQEGDEPDVAKPFVAPRSVPWMMAAVDAITRHFVEDSCGRVMSVRFSQIREEGGSLQSTPPNTTKTSAQAASKESSGSGGGGFLSSLSNMISRVVAEDDSMGRAEEGSLSEGGRSMFLHSESDILHMSILDVEAGTGGGTGAGVTAASPTKYDGVKSKSKWSLLPMDSLITLDVLCAAIEIGLPACLIDVSKKSSPRQESIVQEQRFVIWRNTLHAIACVMSPWLSESELLCRRASSLVVGGTADSSSSPAALSSNDVLLLESSPASVVLLQASDDAAMREAADRMSRILNTITTCALTSEELDSKSLSQFISTLCVSSRLILLGIYEDVSPQRLSGKSAVSSDDPVVTSLRFHMSVLSLCHASLLRLCAFNEVTNARHTAMQSRALRSVLGIVEDLCQMSSVSNGQQFSASRGGHNALGEAKESAVGVEAFGFINCVSIHELCARYLTSLLEAKSDLSSFDFRDPLRQASSGSVFKMLRSWCDLISHLETDNNQSLQVLSSVGAGNTIFSSDGRKPLPASYRPSSFARKEGGGDGAVSASELVEQRALSSASLNGWLPVEIAASHSTLDSKCHVFALLEIAQKLVYSPCAELRHASVKLMRSVSVVDLASNYRALLVHASKLQVENKKLTGQVIADESAAASLVQY